MLYLIKFTIRFCLNSQIIILILHKSATLFNLCLTLQIIIKIQYVNSICTTLRHLLIIVIILISRLFALHHVDVTYIFHIYYHL